MWRGERSEGFAFSPPAECAEGAETQGKQMGGDQGCRPMAAFNFPHAALELWCYSVARRGLGPGRYRGGDKAGRLSTAVVHCSNGPDLRRLTVVSCRLHDEPRVLPVMPPKPSDLPALSFRIPADRYFAFLGALPWGGVSGPRTPCHASGRIAASPADRRLR